MKQELESWRKFLYESKLRVFDFDDTLAVTDGKVIVNHIDGTSEPLDPAEYAVYEKQPGDQFDYSDFDRVINPVEIEEISRIMKRVIDAEERDGTGRKVAILTARDAPAREEIMNFIENMLEIPPHKYELVTLGDSDPNKKKMWIKDQIELFDIRDVLFFDDSPKNIDAVDELKQEYPDVTIVTRLVGYGENYKEGKERQAPYEGPQDSGEFQKKMRDEHPKWLKNLIGQGGNKETGGGKGHKRPKLKRAKSSPPGAGGS
tara:strand:+ start:5148 stop:5927 length:780 start_codon:yes stop_codon:yes gene_type:complete